MYCVKKTLLRLVNDNSGQSIVEYALLVGLIALAVIAGLSSVATAVSTAFSKIGSYLNSSIT